MHPELDDFITEKYPEDKYKFTELLEKLSFVQLRRFVSFLYKECVGDFDSEEDIENVRKEIERNGNPIRDNAANILTKLFYANVQVGEVEGDVGTGWGVTHFWPSRMHFWPFRMHFWPFRMHFHHL